MIASEIGGPEAVVLRDLSEGRVAAGFGTPTATPTDTATAARPPRRSSTPAAPTSRPPSNASQELLSSKHTSSSLAGTTRTAAFGQWVTSVRACDDVDRQHDHIGRLALLINA
jgi:hypothetical protein